MPAFYVLYSLTTKSFYYESINDFAKTLYDKNNDWHLQLNHTIRFSKILDSQSIDDIYNMVLKRGKFQRILNEKINIQNQFIQPDNKILIDSDFNINSDKDIRRTIEVIGFKLLNEARWKDIIAVHKKASGNVATSAVYNLILGMANYYSGNLIEALAFFKTAIKLKIELNEGLQNYLLFFETTVKCSIGFISENEYYEKVKQLSNMDGLGLYIRLEQARKFYIDSINENFKENFKVYEKQIYDIINSPKIDTTTKLNAKCELILFGGQKINTEYVQQIARINALEELTGVDIKIRYEFSNYFSEELKQWYKQVYDARNEALNINDYFSYYNVLINEIKVRYQFIVYVSQISAVKEIPNIPKLQMPDNNLTLYRMLEGLKEAYEYFYSVGHIHNVTISLFTSYEILHYLEEFERMNLVLREIESHINNYDLKDLNEVLSLIKLNGPTHEQFKSFLNDIFQNSIEKEKEFEILKSNMIQMDNEEQKSKKNISYEDSFIIELFPIGQFIFPKDKKKLVFKILNIDKKTMKIFENMFEETIPIANILNNPIVEEGYANGMIDDKDIENWRNIYRIREAFYENGFYRYSLQ